MDKAEELKQEFIKKWEGRHWLPTQKVAFMTDLDEYTEQVSRERTFKFLRRFFRIDPDDKDVNAAYNKYFNHQNQQEG